MRRLAMALCLAAFVSGCQSDPAQVLSPDKFVAATSGATGSNVSTNAPGGTNAAARVVRPGITISITVNEDPSLTRVVTVPGSGTVDFQPLGRIVVDGLSPDEVAQTIKSGLEKDYFQTATVIVAIESMTAAGGVGSGIIYVLGAVGRPGPLLVGKEQQLTVMKAIVAAGGFGQFANERKVELIRYDANGKKFKTTIDVKQIMEGAFERDVPVMDGDWIIVREKLVNF